MIYYFFPETARLSLEEIAKNFGDDIAVEITTANDEERARLARQLENADVLKQEQEKEKEKAQVQMTDANGNGTHGSNGSPSTADFTEKGA